MTITEAHKLAAEALGEMSLAIVKREAPDHLIRRWVLMLRQAAAGLEARLAAGEKTA